MTDANDSSSPTPANQEVASEELETPAKVDDSEVATDLSKKSSVTVKAESDAPEPPAPSKRSLASPPGRPVFGALPAKRPRFPLPAGMHSQQRNMFYLFQCQLCGFPFLDIASLQSHTIAVHTRYLLERLQ
ncbi:hypothetical protein AAVH_24676 [Aphelenchoides avenae]|nr:hypothetical protein AAVH_24676 [Aphelenchus avenae]